MNPVPHPLLKEVLNNYKLPFKLMNFQVETVNELIHYAKTAMWADPGCTKTAMSTLLALCKAHADEIDNILVIVPPILITQWVAWLRLLDIDALAYKGTPAQRKAMDLNHDAVVMSLPIFKKDYKRMVEHYRHQRTFVIIDECANIRNTGTLNYKAARDFTRLPDKQLTLLSGTPVGNPMHGYAYCSIKNPGLYRSMAQFKLLHVTAVDQYNQPVSFQNLDMLKENLMLHSVRVDADEVLELPKLQTIPINYDLEPKHYRQYKTLIEERLLVLGDEVIDAITAQSLYHSAQRLILKSSPDVVPAAFSVVTETAMELDMPTSGEKLVVFVNYQDSNRELFAYISKQKGLNPVQVYGKTGPKKNQDNIQAFLNDPDINVMIGQPTSVGVGVDNLQSVCRAVIFMELPLTSNNFQQCIARIYRQGQKKHCIAKFMVANDTIQATIARNIISKEDVVQKIVPTKQTLRGALYGS